MLWESRWQVTFKRVYFTKLRCGRYWFLNEFCCWKLKQIAKVGFRRKNQLSPQMCSHCQILKNSILKMWKIKNVSTLGPIDTYYTSTHDQRGCINIGKKWVAKTIMNINFTWPTRCCSMHPRNPSFFPLGKKGTCTMNQHLDFLFILMISMCSHQVPIKFSMCSRQLPNVFFLFVFSTCYSMSQYVP